LITFVEEDKEEDNESAEPESADLAGADAGPLVDAVEVVPVP
jgi:hypothetical protein